MKIGIATQYYRNYNYGANLQAYALVKVCNDLGHEAEQISFMNCGKFHFLLSKLKEFSLFLFKFGFSKRRKAIRQFNKLIPHSRLYFQNELKLVDDKYDFFIVGSDQVWNPNSLNDFYKLSFVQNKPKISFSASLGRKELSDSESKEFKCFLSDYSRVSVREHSSVALLEEITKRKIDLTLDPTLLLSYEEWDMLSSDFSIKDDYIFCYFLNDNMQDRTIAMDYAKKEGLRIVTLPYLSYKKRICDDDFGDLRLYNITPNDFISLIKNAKFVFTDSFHACVFSHIFRKDFIVFNDKNSEAGSRLETLTKMFNTSERYITSNMSINHSYLKSLPKMKSIYESDVYNKLLKNSYDYLKDLLLYDKPL